MTLLATWQLDGASANLRDDSDGLWATLTLIEDWYVAGSRLPTAAWVVEWLSQSDGEREMVRTRLDLPPIRAKDEDKMTRFAEVAAAVARGSSPAEPDAFGHALTGPGEGSEIHRRIELVSQAIQEAASRLDQAAQVVEPWGASEVLIALTETISWIRALDDSMAHVWRTVGDDIRTKITVSVDEALARPGWDPDFVAWAQASRDGNGYPDWTVGLLTRSTGVSRGELSGVRWLAGKMLHFGPLPAAELRQWREGEPPRWKWRKSSEIFPTRRGERNSYERSAYDQNLAGRDLIGTFNLFNQLHAAEFLAWDISGRPDN